MRIGPIPAPSIVIRIAAMLLLCPLTAPAFAFGFRGDHHPDRKHQIELLEFEWRAAQLAGDLPVIDRLLADDYVGISMNGKVNTKAQLLSRMRDHHFEISRLDLKDMKVKVLGDVAIVTVRAAVQGTSDGSPVNGLFRYTRIYHHLPSGAWKITNFEATRIPSRQINPTVVAQTGSTAG